MQAAQKNISTIQEEEKKLRQILETVVDPEIPVLSIIDLGIVRDVVVTSSSLDEGWEVTVVITPTYSGCPAMDMISMNIKLALIEHGYKKIKITSVLSPPWTTDWLSEQGKEKLKQYGIAPPIHYVSDKQNVPGSSIPCPLCNSLNTKLISQFGSTACKALYQCNDCQEPFDYFKCH